MNYDLTGMIFIIALKMYGSVKLCDTSVQLCETFLLHD
jgi:hypothetical protein